MHVSAMSAAAGSLYALSRSVMSLFTTCLPLAAVLTLIPAAPATAQQNVPAQNIADIPGDGTCDEDQLANIDLPGDWRRGIGYTFALKSGNHLTVSARSSTAVSRPLKALDEVTLFGIDPGSGKVLVQVKPRNLCGWVDPKDGVLLLDPGGPIDSQTYRDGPSPMTVGESLFRGGDTGSSLNLRIVIHSTNMPGGESVPLYETPGGGRLPGAEKQFGIFEVFKVETAMDPRLNRPGRFYLAGWTPAGSGLVHKRLRGWVSEDDVYAWTTRMAVMWEGSADALGYVDLDKLKTGRRSAAAFRKDRGFREEDEISRRAITPRLPLLQQSPSEGQLREKFGHPPSAAEIDAGVEAYLVAVPLTPSGGQQQTTAYWFPSLSGGRPTFTFWVALERPALERLQFISNSICQFVGNAGAFVYIRNDILSVTGTDVQELTPAEAIEKRLFIPAFRLSSFMNKTWKDIEQEIEEADDKKIEAIEKEFCRKSTLLSAVLQGFRIAPEALDWHRDAPKGERYAVPARAKRPFAWINDSIDGLPFYYIPVSYLP
jgi:hypothetical protein